MVQLRAALHLKGTHKPVDYGSMTVVIRYWTPYLINNTSSLIIYFTLGNDVSLRSVLGILCPLAMCVGVDLVQGQLICSELNQWFILQLDPPGKILPDGANFDTTFTTVLMVFCPIFHPCRRPFSILPLMTPLLLCLGILIQIILKLRIILFNGVFLVTWCTTRHLVLPLHDTLLREFIRLLFVYYLPLQF